MAAELNLRDGNLQDTLSQLQGQVRKEPANADHRVFLFQLLSVLGNWERAMTQLNVAADLDASTLMMAQAYREALRCEALRTEIFAGRRTPLVFGDPDKWVALLLEALRVTADGHFAQANELREQAFEAAPATAGSIDGEAFEWIADADVRMGPTLEAIVNGQYYWVPYNCIRTIEMEEPNDLRDMVWMPAHFVWANGGDAVGLIPTRYPESHASDDDDIRMNRRTEWIEGGSEIYFGLGQRLIATDAGEYPIMDIRNISLESPAVDDAADTSESGAGEDGASNG